jgi:3-deoxy-D-manno-octulosonic acid kinase
MQMDFTAAASFTCYTLLMMDLNMALEKNNRIGNEAGCFFCYDAAHLPSLGSAQFNADGYPSAQVVTDAGGRGSAWFVQSAAGPAVLKHYRRGGWMARLSQNAYVFTGLERSRAMAEFNVLQTLQAHALPVPTPLAAFCWRGVLSYRAALLTQRIANATSLAGQCRQGQPAWAAAGALVARFHRSGAEHSDLNAENMLFDADGCGYLIDWDKGRLHTGPGAWCNTVLARLQRSLEKMQRQGEIAEFNTGWARLLAAYHEGMR